MSYNNPISSSDPDAITKLTEKLEKCKGNQEYMKAVNSYYRKYGTCKGFPDMPDDTAIKIDDKIASDRTWETAPFSSWALQNNNSEIKRIEKRIEQLTQEREVGFSGWEFFKGRAEANTELHRLQLFFDEKPNETERLALKRNGFKWAPSQAAWQRQLNDNAIFAAGYLDFLKPIDGRSVREHQPKPPARHKDTGAR